MQDYIGKILLYVGNLFLKIILSFIFNVYTSTSYCIETWLYVRR